MIETFELHVNGSRRKLRATADMPLLWALRQELGLSGPKFGCGAGLCGACMVHVDGNPMPSCQLPVGDIGDAKITTLEGLTGDPIAEQLRAAWLEIDVMQCGYCQAGQIMRAVALLREKSSPSSEDVDEAMEGNICRCATYPRIRKAILIASGQEQ